MHNILFVAIGLAAGVVAGIFGIGGGVLVVPALVLLAKFPPQVATGTSLGVLLMPVGILGAYAYYKEGHVRIVPALLIGLGVFFGAYVGAMVAHQMSPLMLKRAFALFLVVIAARLWFAK
jgi:uncharacterized membrane protein YfcA